MATLRLRDIQAIAFCLVAIAGAGFLADRLAGPWAGSTSAAAMAAWLLSRARMRRLWLRIRGKPVLNSWDRYFDGPEDARPRARSGRARGAPKAVHRTDAPLQTGPGPVGP